MENYDIVYSGKDLSKLNEEELLRELDKRYRELFFASYIDKHGESVIPNSGIVSYHRAEETIKEEMARIIDARGIIEETIEIVKVARATAEVLP